MRTTRRGASRRGWACARTVAGAALCLSSLAALPAVAQDPAPAAGTGRPSADRRLTLAQALEIAERGNPQLRQVANDVDAAEGEQRAARAGYLPDLSASIGLNGNSTRTLTGEDEFGKPVRGESRTFRSSSAQQSLSTSLVLFDGGAREKRVAAARAQVGAAEASVSARRAQLRAEVSAQYYRARNATTRIALEERLVEAAREQFAATERRFGIAAASREDVLGAEADLATAQARLENARGDASKAILLLRQQLGLEDTTPIVLTDSIRRPPAGATLDADALVARAAAAHPVLSAARARADAAARSASAARGAHWPSVSASAGYSRSDRANDYASFFDFNPAGSQGFNFGLRASLPIFDGFRTAAAEANADAQAADARESVRAERLRLEQEVRSAVIDVDNARRGLALAERAAALSRERAELARERYRAGATDFVQYQLVLRSAAEAERGELDAGLELAVAWVQLERTVGGPVETP
ncbi:MAG: TolC family protein [Gemmatimonadaceae bacterium]